MYAWKPPPNPWSSGLSGEAIFILRKIFLLFRVNENMVSPLEATHSYVSVHPLRIFLDGGWGVGVSLSFPPSAFPSLWAILAVG